MLILKSGRHHFHNLYQPGKTRNFVCRADKGKVYDFQSKVFNVISFTCGLMCRLITLAEPGIDWVSLQAEKTLVVPIDPGYSTPKLMSVGHGGRSMEEEVDIHYRLSE